MGWYLLWMPLGAAAFLLALVNLSLVALKKHRGWQALLFTSLSCGMLAVLAGLQMVNHWLQQGDWAAIEDVVPAFARLRSIAAGVGIILNLLALWVHLREEKNNGKS